jgi:hypothetical protein
MYMGVRFPWTQTQGFQRIFGQSTGKEHMMVLRVMFVQVCFFLSVVAFGTNTVCCMTVYCGVYAMNIRDIEYPDLYT